MVTVGMTCIEQIGEAAGRVWHVLNDNGPMSMTKLVKELGAPRDLILQGLGWLAREGKIEIVESKRGRIISLRDRHH